MNWRGGVHVLLQVPISVSVSGNGASDSSSSAAAVAEGNGEPAATENGSKPTVVADTDQSTTVTESVSSTNVTPSVKAESGEQKSGAVERVLLKFDFTIKLWDTKIVLELQFVEGENPDALHQILQFLKNRLH